MINTYEARTEPGYIFTIIPKPLAIFILGLFFFLAMVIAAENYFHKAVMFGFLVWDLFYVSITWANYRNYLVSKAMKKGKEQKRVPTFAATGRRIFSDVFGWKTVERVTGRNGKTCDYMINHDGSVSIAFEWDGVKDAYYSVEEWSTEHARRLGLLTLLAMDNGFFVEHHLIRGPDSRLANAYEAVGRRMFKGKEPPRIVADVRKGIAEIARAMGRSNRVFTVLSMTDRASNWLGFLPSTYKRNRDQAACAKKLIDCWQTLSSYYPSARLLDREEYKRLIERVSNPYGEELHIDWRFALNEQLMNERPSWDADVRCLVSGSAYIKVFLFQGYPNLLPQWTQKFIDPAIDIHVCQILRPKHTQKALDEAKEQASAEAGTMNERKSNALLGKRLQDIHNYAEYVAHHRIPILDNAYIVTFYSTDKEYLEKFARQFSTMMRTDRALLRDDEDLQREMYRTRLPGLGRTSLFLREDHGDTIAAMMPFSTFDIGSHEPECLRVAMSGQLVGFSPSKLTVPHELVVAKTGGGKDVQFGMKLLETYPLIRYDIVEMGNSYQGVIEAIGGRYCRAKEQVINPLMSYADFRDSVRMASGGKVSTANTLEAQALESQRTVLAPIFKGMKGEDFTITEKVVMDQSLRALYLNPKAGVEAPALPMLLEAINRVALDQSRYEEARNTLGEALYDFMQQGVGTSFKEQDQFIISSIANAIDFDKFSGDLADYFMTFMCHRLANNAFARGMRSQIVLNEYKVLQEKSPDVIRWITTAIDRMGRKDWVGLTRITQGYEEIRKIDSEAQNSIANRTLLYRTDQHDDIGNALLMPPGLIAQWKTFESPNEIQGKDYREAIVCENDQWFRLVLRFPQIGLKLMNTDPNNKGIREAAYRMTQDAYERIQILDAMMAERNDNERKEKAKYATAII